MNEEYLCCMSEDLNIIAGTKAEQYESLIPQIKGLLEGEPDMVANLANVVAALKEQFDWLWIGFYLVKPALHTAENKKGGIGARAIPGSGCMHQDQERKRSLRHQLGKGTNNCSS